MAGVKTTFPYSVDYSSTFRKDWKKLSHSGRYNMEALKASMLLVIKNEPMPEEYLLHRLKGNKYPDYLEFHVGGDFLCIYTLDEATGTVIFARCGTHSELF